MRGCFWLGGPRAFPFAARVVADGSRLSVPPLFIWVSVVMILLEKYPETQEHRDGTEKASESELLGQS